MLRIIISLAVVALLAACKAQDSTSPGASTTPPPAGRTVPTVQDMVMYEVNIRAFSPAGNLAGVTAGLDSIKALGVNVVWLMPIYEEGILRSVGSPYCIKNFTAINPEYGTLQDLQTLVREAHNKGMTVILDWVANHTSFDHAWLNNPGWHTRVNGQVVTPMPEWQDVADLNFDSAPMRVAMIDAMKYWVTAADVDGFRCDAADMVPYSFWRQAVDSLRRMPGRNLVLLAEGERNDHLTAGFNLNFSWLTYAGLERSFRNGVTPNDLYRSQDAEFRGATTLQAPLRFSTNHDKSAWEGTPVTVFGGIQGSFSAFTIAAFSGGVPLIYSSQEVGRVNTLPFFKSATRSTINWNENPGLKQQYKSIMQVYRSHAKWRSRNTTYMGNATVWAVRKNVGSDVGYVVANTRNTVQTLTIPAGLSTVYATGTVNIQGTTLTLAPYQVVLLQ